MRTSRRLALASVLLVTLPAAAAAATIPVTTTADALAQDGACSLREAVYAARFNTPVDGTLGVTTGCPAGSATQADAITLGAGTFELLPGASGSEDANESGDLDTGPASALRVVGMGSGATVIDALLGDRAFDVFPGSSLGLEDLTIRRGRAPAGSPGGGVRNQGALTVVRVVFEGNQGGAGVPESPDSLDGAGGGAIWSGNVASASVLVGDSAFVRNSGGAGGPGFNVGTTYYWGGDGGDGSAIAIETGTAEISGTTFSGNHAGDGGEHGPSTFDGDGGSGALAVTDPASATVINSTFVGNTAGLRHAKYFDNDHPAAGAAIRFGAGGGLRISWSTFVSNSRGPDARSEAGNAVANAQVSASVLADAAPACRNVTTAGLPNVLRPDDSSCNIPKIAGDPRLAPLAANGGPTPTVALGAGSIAINALAGVPCPATDQRGLPRPALGACDAGAFEVQPGTPAAAGVGAASGGARTITRLAIAPSAFRAAGRRPLGTTVSYRLSTAGRVVLRVRRPAAGKRSRGACVAPTRRLRTARNCLRQVTLRGSLATRGVVGLNLLRFSGTLRGRALRPGRYTLVLTLPRAGATPAVSATRRFRILA